MSVLDVVDEKLTLVPINRDEPAIRLLRMRYLERYALPQENVSNATRWFGVKRGPRGAVVAVIGERYDAAHNASEITDFYVQPSRDGALAMRAVIKFYKQLFESKKRLEEKLGRCGAAIERLSG